MNLKYSLVSDFIVNMILSRLKKNTFNAPFQYISLPLNITRYGVKQAHQVRQKQQTRQLVKGLGVFITSLLLCACGTFNKPHNDEPSTQAAEPRPHSHDAAPMSRSTGQSSTTPTEKLYICEDITQYVNRHVGNGECVDLLKACAKTPHTQQWRPGKPVWGNHIPTGTAIATFKQARYPNQHGYHAAIYVSQDDKGIYVWDQWREKAVHLRLIRFDKRKKKPGNDATRYRVITQ